MYFNIKEIEAPELANWIEEKSGTFRIIDVREMREIVGGTVPGAEPMPMATIPVRMQEISRDETVVFVCRSGARSAQACAFLAQQDYNNVYNLRGGILNWAKHGLPAVLPKTA